jgi:hypothetical protein
MRSCAAQDDHDKMTPEDKDRDEELERDLRELEEAGCQQRQSSLSGLDRR